MTICAICYFLQRMSIILQCLMCVFLPLTCEAWHTSARQLFIMMTGDSHAAVVTANLMLIYICTAGQSTFWTPCLSSLALRSVKTHLLPKKLPTPAENDSPFSSKYLQSDSKSLSRLCNSFAAFRRQRFVSEIEISGAHKQKFYTSRLGLSSTHSYEQQPICRKPWQLVTASNSSMWQVSSSAM